ncbi:uncharacterized protein LOC114828134 [Galendromus occidentalis]|uniref:Uncharacterized protein LOC114828134 n=1 Tax=Galendromus occidentalis TaxID=34638 RepID=A0AAJ7WH41_9ACAR|nr:uncharacterized protein LOC114828134 [Galendromus occidentalis]
MASAIHYAVYADTLKGDKIRSPFPPVSSLSGLFSGREKMAAHPFGPMALPVPPGGLPKLGAHPDNPGLDIWLQLTRNAAEARHEAERAYHRQEYAHQTELPDSPCDLRVSPRPISLVKQAYPVSKAGSPSSGGGAPVKRRGRGKERIWTQIECFNNDAQAKAFVQAEKTWVMQKKTQVQEGTKVYYECSKYRSAKCPAAVSILYHANSDKVSVFRASGDHNHAPLEPRHKNTAAVTTTTAALSARRPEGTTVIKNGQEIARLALQAGGPYSPPDPYRVEVPTLHRPVATYPSVKRQPGPDPAELRQKFKHIIGINETTPHIRAPEPPHFDYTNYLLQQYPSHHHHHLHHHHPALSQIESPPIIAFRPLPRETKLIRDGDGGSSPARSDPGHGHESGSESSTGSPNDRDTVRSVISRTPSASLSLPDATRCFVPNCKSNSGVDLSVASPPSSSGISSSSSSSISSRCKHSSTMVRFPKDILKRMVWSMNVNRTNHDGSLCIAQNGDHICSAHFSPERFEQNGALKPDAVPTMFGPDLVSKDPAVLEQDHTDCKVTTSKEVPVRRSRLSRKRARSVNLLRRLQRAQHTVDRLRLNSRAQCAKINILRRMVAKCMVDRKGRSISSDRD